LSADEAARAKGFVDAQAHREFWIAAAASLLFSITTCHSALVAIALQRTGYDLRAIGILIGVTAAPVLLVTVFSGVITARLGARGALRLAMLLLAIGVGSLAVTRVNFWAAMASRLVWGAGVGLFLSPMMVYVQSRLTPLRFVYLVAAFSSTIPLALAIAPPIGELILDRFGETAMFTVGAVPALIAAVMTTVLRPLARPDKPGGGSLLRAARPWHLLPIAGLVVGGAHYGYASAYLAPALREHGTALGWFFVPMTMAMIYSRVGAMRRLSALPPRLLATGGLIASSLALVVCSYQRGPAVAALAGAMLGAGNSMMYPVISAWLGRGAAPAERPGVQALTSTGFYVGVYLTPWPETYLIELGGYGLAQVVMGVLGTALGIALALASRLDRAGSAP
jgi:predicted MFS family arabinose efflux permease